MMDQFILIGLCFSFINSAAALVLPYPNRQAIQFFNFQILYTINFAIFKVVQIIMPDCDFSVTNIHCTFCVFILQ